MWYLARMVGSNPFPVGQPIRPEERQIGRGPAIDALHQQVVENRRHTLLIEERRVGKTSVAWAVLDRVRSAGRDWVVEVNLKRGPITSSIALAQMLAEQARAAGIRVESRSDQLLEKFKTGVHIAGSPLSRVIGGLLGMDAIEDGARLAEAIDQILAADDEDEADLRSVLGALTAAAIAADRVLVIFIDEAQRLATEWADGENSLFAQEAFAEIMEGHEGHAVLLFAGSERGSLEDLFADGQPMYYDGMAFPLPEIKDADWQFELPRRFDEVGLTVSSQHVVQILDATGGHPERTMSVCSHVRELAEGGKGVFEIEEILIGQAIERAKKHPSWRS